MHELGLMLALLEGQDLELFKVYELLLLLLYQFLLLFFFLIVLQEIVYIKTFHQFCIDPRDHATSTLHLNNELLIFSVLD